MPLLHDKKAIFIHIPKTGGKSLTTLFFPAGRSKSRRKDLEGPMTLPALGVRHLSHLTHDLVRELAGEEVWRNYWKFAFVRNPLDRTVSNYFYLQQKFPSHEHPMLGFTHNDTFEVFVHRLAETLPKIYSYDIWGRDHFVPQYEFVYDGDQRVVDFLGKFENFEEDAQVVLSKLGITAAIPKVNTTSHKPYREYYSLELESIVRELYKKDFELFYETD